MAQCDVSKSRGRPSGYTESLGKTICLRISEGESLRSVCRDSDMPSKSMVMRWMTEFENFRDQYIRAREIQIDQIAEEILDIADDATNDWMEREGKTAAPGYTLNGEHVQRSRLRVDARKWLLAKMSPKKYGDRIEHVGETTVRNVIAAEDITEDEWRRRYEDNLGAAEGPPKGIY